MDFLDSLEPQIPAEEDLSPGFSPKLSPKAQHRTMDVGMAEENDFTETADRVRRQVYKAEHSSIGRVATNHYMLVFKAAGGAFYWLMFALIFGLAVVINQVMMPLLFREWSGDKNASHVGSYLVTYLSLTLIGIFFGSLGWIWLYGVGNVGFYNRGSRAIHVMLLDVICTAPLRFFEETPKGRIMNIFGQDMFRLDGFSADDFGREFTFILLWLILMNRYSNGL